MLQPHALLLYKNRPVRLLRMDERLEVEQEDGSVLKVRPKDVEFLHPGPIMRLADLQSAPEGEVQAAWEILAGSKTRLAELAELAYGAFTPVTAWAAWQVVAEGLFFTGRPDAIQAVDVEDVARKQHDREQAAAGRRAWQGLIERVKQASILPDDREALREVEALALERTQHSQVLRALNRAETPENAHSLLLTLGVWDVTFNPYPLRLHLPLEQPDLPVPASPLEARLDLTHLQAFAIDDAGTDTPDDAISLDGERLWVHVADVASLVLPDSDLDMAARARALSLHLPEGTIHLLPREITERLGLGMMETNPALSFGIDLSADGEVLGFEVKPSWVRVTRLTYDSANEMMDREPFRTLEQRLAAARLQRQQHGAVLLDFPEVRLAVVDQRVEIHPIRTLRSRTMVEEAMILAGRAVAQFAIQLNLVMPFSQQEPPESEERPTSLSGMFALRKLMKRSHHSSMPGPHSGLGVPAYVQVTSPLRRYFDLVAHQQLRALIYQQAALTESAMIERIGQVDSVLASVRQAEGMSERHWTMVYLLQNPNWQGEGIVIDRRGSSGIVLVPDLDVEARAHLPESIGLDQLVKVRVTGVQLPQREASWRVEGR